LKLERSHLFGKIAMLFPKSRAYRERSGSVAPSIAFSDGGLTFRPLEMGDQRFRPLDHRAVASGFFYLLKKISSINGFILRAISRWLSFESRIFKL
jgi:hypothetical protein